MEKENMILEYYDKINDKDYYVEFDINSLMGITNELITIKNTDKTGLGVVTVNRLVSCIYELISGNVEVLDVLLYQNKFTDKYSKEINLLEQISVNKIASDSVEDIIHGNALENYNKDKEPIDLLKKKMYFEETLYREYLTKILCCLNLTIINEKSLKKVK